MNDWPRHFTIFEERSLGDPRGKVPRLKLPSVPELSGHPRYGFSLLGTCDNVDVDRVTP